MVALVLALAFAPIAALDIVLVAAAVALDAVIKVTNTLLDVLAPNVGQGVLVTTVAS